MIKSDNNQQAPTGTPSTAAGQQVAIKQVENAIERLLALLDSLQGDENLEDGADDEYWLAGAETDREADTSDDEPYLSAGAIGFSTTGGNGNEVDYENNERVVGGQGL